MDGDAQPKAVPRCDEPEGNARRAWRSVPRLASENVRRLGCSQPYDLLLVFQQVGAPRMDQIPFALQFASATSHLAAAQRLGLASFAQTCSHRAFI
ncbi:MAG TPA: hypothetical protein VIL65_18455 [Beijerinckiaceae bacterium]